MLLPFFLYIYRDDAITNLPSGRYVDKVPDSSKRVNSYYYYYFDIDSGYTYGTDVFIYPIDSDFKCYSDAEYNYYSINVNTAYTYSQPSNTQLLIKTWYISFAGAYMITVTKARIVYLH